ncbi:hypothetical protein GAO09_03775 [Rhizobiales bacterium RZME27]|uniref:Uncharacterized protein n=1 Tax=Endobacterium cereale TaxID=2663029 RepID=A0A6A8A5Q2_9HYPH|nr:hypothetical protein [Endobacterium cereale]MEB2846562.1 hypothetical protein [Endobacterium cereale]MQY45187.1 hypothetical protein [Endobacterium cereale]
MKLSTSRVIMLTLSFCYAISPAYGAGLKPESKDGAMIAGGYTAVNEACFAGKGYLTPQALKFAREAKRKNSKWFFAAYNEETQGSTAYDEPFCNTIIFKLYEAKGEDSRKLGFRIMNTDSFAE